MIWPMFKVGFLTQIILCYFTLFPNKFQNVADFESWSGPQSPDTVLMQ